MTDREQVEEAVARIIVEAVRAARDLYPGARPDSIEAMARLLLQRAGIVLKDPGALS